MLILKHRLGRLLLVMIVEDLQLKGIVQQATKTSKYNPRSDFCCSRFQYEWYLKMVQMRKRRWKLLLVVLVFNSHSGSSQNQIRCDGKHESHWIPIGVEEQRGHGGSNLHLVVVLPSHCTSVNYTVLRAQYPTDKIPLTTQFLFVLNYNRLYLEPLLYYFADITYYFQLIDPMV